MGGKTSTSTSQVQIPPEVMANYNAVNAMAKEAAAKPFQTYSSDPNQFVAQMNQTQLNAMGPLNIDQYKNPYINDVVKSTMDVVNQQNQQAQAGQLGTAISSGAFGGDRSGIAAANLAQQQQMANAQIASGLYSDAYNQAVATAQQQQGFQFGAGTLQQQTDQAGLTALYNQWLQQQAYPFQTAQFLGNIAMGTGALSGSTTTTTQPYSYFKRGGSVRSRLADGGIPGPYSAPVGSIPGLAGYIPDPYLPVSDILTADPSYSDMAQQSAADYANKIAEYSKAIQSTFFADGGVVDPRGYLGSVLDAQEKDRSGLHPAEKPKSEKSGGLGEIIALAAKFMSRGGYADGGNPEQDEWEKTVEQMRAHAVPPDQLNIPSGLGMARVDTAPTSGVVPANPDLTTNAVQPQAMPPVKDMGEIAPAPQFGLGTAKMPAPAQQPGFAPVAIPRGGMAEHLMNTFVGAGIPAAAAQGILMNIHSESGLNPAAVGDSGSSYGFVQLHGPRRDAYMAAASAAGVDPADPTFQSQYIINDLQQNYPEVYDAMLKAPDAGTAAVIFMDGYERPAKQYRDQRAAQYTGGNMPISDVGLGGANMTSPAGVDPTYAERNALGQIFYNPNTNKLDKNALLAVLGGIGTMASSPSRFLGSAILQGLGGFANTYANLQSQAPDIEAKRFANANAARIGFERAKALGYTGTYEDFIQNPVGAGPQGVGTAPQGGSTTPSYQGVPLDVFGSGMSQMINIGGKQVQAGQSYGYLKAIENEMSRKKWLGIVDQQAIADVRAKIADIEAKQGYVIATDGSVVQDPSYTGVLFGGTRAGSDVQRTQELYSGIQDQIINADNIVRNNQELTEAFANMPNTGPMSGALAQLSNIGQQFGIDQGDYANNYQFAYKVLSQETSQAINNVAGQVDSKAYSDLLSMTNPSPEMSAGAIDKILGIRSGIARFEMEKAKAINNARINGIDNIAEVERQFVSQNPPSKYINEEIPKFDGVVSSHVNKYANAPEIGSVENGYKYIGGDPSKQSSWEVNE